MIVKTIRLEPQIPVETIEEWIAKNCVSEANILWTNLFTNHVTKQSFHLTAEVEFADIDEAALFMMRWS